MGGVTILRDKELNGLLIDTNNNRVIGAILVTNDNENFSFDIAIDSGYQNMGLSHKLIQASLLCITYTISQLNQKHYHI